MKIYIWEGNGISAAYHDDGMLVVLAESPDDARATARQARADNEAWDANWYRQRDELAERLGYVTSQGTIRAGFWALDEAKALGWPKEGFWDGADDALNREPDRVVEVTTPCIVAFNGGGYD